MNIIGNKINSFFINVGKTLAKQIPGSNRKSIYCINSNDNNPFSVRLFLPVVTENEVCDVLGTIKDSSTARDGLKVYIMKQIIITPLVRICNISFVAGIFSDELKMVNMVPSFKSQGIWLSQTICVYYCYPFFSKSLEKLAYDCCFRLHSIATNNHTIISVGFKEVNWPATQFAVMMFIAKSPKVWITNSVPLVYFMFFKGIRH